MRGSRIKGPNVVDMVSVWCYENSLVLGQVAVTNKAEEITAFSELIKFLEINLVDIEYIILCFLKYDILCPKF